MLPDKALKWAQLGMRKLRRWVGRVREVIVRSRMRATTGMPMTLAERASLELCDDDDEFNDAQEHEPMRGSAASLTPLLLQGHFLLARRIEETNGEEPGWKVVRLVNDVVRHREDDQTAPRTRRLTVIEGVSVGNADEQKGGTALSELEFVDAHTNRRTMRGDQLFPMPQHVHGSRMYVVEPEQTYFTDDGVVLCLSEDQIEDFGRIAYLSANLTERALVGE